MFQHPGAPDGKRTLQRQRRRQGNHRQPPQLDRGRPRPVARPTGGRRLFLRGRKRQRGGNGRRGRLLLFPGLFPGPSGVRVQSPLHHWGVLRRALRPRHFAPHLAGQPEIVRELHPPQLFRSGHWQRIDGPRGAVPVVPGNGLEQLARHQGRRRGALQRHEGGRPPLHQTHPRVRPGRRGRQFLCLPGGLCHVQPRPDLAVPGHGAQPVRHSQEVRGPAAVLRLFQRQGLAQPGFDQAGARRRHDPQPPVGGLQFRHQRQVPHGLDEGLFRIRQGFVGGRLSGTHLRRRRGLYLQLPREPGLDEGFGLEPQGRL
mmetsp:Transcript_28700/g.77723  ORF Transcript_28700/g.77723 Transcript_28700/m.77723 type:complete len:314 (+) Transcript_28700:744-1685(+)